MEPNCEYSLFSSEDHLLTSRSFMKGVAYQRTIELNPYHPLLTFSRGLLYQWNRRLQR